MKIRLLPSALRDVGSIYRWLSARSADAAERAEVSIFAAIDLLGERPGFGRPTDEQGVYRWPMTDFRYTIFFRVRREKRIIEILRVIDGRRVRNLKRVPKK